MALLARFQYDGLPSTVVQHASYSLGHGLTPGVITVEVPAGTATPSLQGTAAFYYGSQSIVLINCKFDFGTSRMGSDQVWSFSIVDGRWPYEFGEISGHYNIRKPDNSIQPGTLKTCQELAVLLLQAMQVDQYDVSQMDNSRNPEVSWSYSNPALALAELADDVGCRPVWNPDGSIRILPLGFGDDLPNLPATSLDFTFNMAAIPAAVKVVAAPTLFEYRWILQAVGLDTDGVWKDIDDLSYKPSAGWGKEDPYMLSGVRNLNAQFTKVQPIWDLAIRTVFRSYRILQLVGNDFVHGVDPENDPFDLKRLDDDEFPKPNYYRHCLPLTSGLIEQQFLESEGGERTPVPAIVNGTFMNRKAMKVLEMNTNYRGAFSIDAQRGIVNFGEPLYVPPGMFYVDNGQTRGSYSDYSPASLTLQIGFHINDATWSPVRPWWIFPLGGSNADGSNIGNKIIDAPETKYWNRQNYDSTGAQSKFETNYQSDNLLQDATELANVYIASLGNVSGGDQTYPGIWAIETDGAIHQVTWSVGRGIPTTRASRNAEHDTDIIPCYAERRRRERVMFQKAREDATPRDVFDRNWRDAEARAAMALQ